MLCFTWACSAVVKCCSVQFVSGAATTDIEAMGLVSKGVLHFVHRTDHWHCVFVFCHQRGLRPGQHWPLSSRWTLCQPHVRSLSTPSPPGGTCSRWALEAKALLKFFFTAVVVGGTTLCDTHANWVDKTLWCP